MPQQYLLGAFICHARAVERPSARRPSDCKGPSAKALAAWTDAIASAALSAILTMPFKITALDVARTRLERYAGTSRSDPQGPATPAFLSMFQKAFVVASPLSPSLLM